MGHEIARAAASVALLAPADGCLTLVPHLRRAQAAGVDIEVVSTGEVPIGGIPVLRIAPPEWPGEPVLLLVDGVAALIGARMGDRFNGHFGHGAAFVAAAGRAYSALREER
jgi:hypothetical protein